MSNVVLSNERLEYMTKTLTLISGQLLFTFFGTSLLLLSDVFKFAILSNVGLLFPVSVVGVIGTMLYAMWNEDNFNETMLGVFTFFETLLLMVFVSLFDNLVVSYALITTLGIVAGLVTFALTTSNDLTKSNMGSYLYCILSSLCWLGFLNMFFKSELLFRIDIYVGTLLFMGYILFDVQLYFRNPNIHLVKNAHIHAAMNIYLDVVNIFIRMVEIYHRYLKDDKRR